MYVIVESAAIEEVFMPIVKRLHEERSSYPRTLIYCRSSSYTDCSSIYLFFKKFLGKHTTEPAGAPDIPGFRLVDMYMSCIYTEVVIKDKIEQLFVMD